MAKIKMSFGADRLIYQRAFDLRNQMTPAEMLLWGHLKGKQLGVRFRRQHPLGTYIADFYCHQCQLVIELDGGIHLKPEVIANDIERQHNLESDGLTVIRFTNEQLFQNIHQVLNIIKQHIKLPL